MSAIENLRKVPEGGISMGMRTAGVEWKNQLDCSVLDLFIHRLYWGFYQSASDTCIVA